METRYVHIKSFGCQMNKLDTALVEAALLQRGFTLTEKVKEADAVVINTCSVREHAEQRVISHLGHLKHIKENKPQLVVAVIGCMAQRLGEELLKQKAVDIVCGPGQICDVPELIESALDAHRKTVSITHSIRKTEPENPALEEFESVYDRADNNIPSQAYVRVMRGCDKFCTYCIVPYVRGPESSRSPHVIIEQVKRLAAEGVKQITFLGQTVNSYEYKAGDKIYCLADILEMAAQIEGIEWIRFVTSYPQQKYFSQICHAMADLAKVCPYLHLPAQSGSDRILKAMNRHYTALEYLNMLDEVRRIVPDISVAGDFIVGFPDETEKDFAETVDLLQKAQYKNAYIFKYSPRPGTTADHRLQDNIPDEVKKQRNITLLNEQEKISNTLSKQFQDATVTVLVEGLSKKANVNKKDQPQLIGRTPGDWIVVFHGPQTLAGSFAKVKIVQTSPLTLFGDLI